MVADIQREMRKGELTPDRGANYDNVLSSLLGNCLEEIREADAAYNAVYLRELEARGKANRAKVVAETSPEFLRRQEARDTEKLILEMVRSLRHLGRVNSDAMRLQR